MAAGVAELAIGVETNADVDVVGPGAGFLAGWATCDGVVFVVAAVAAVAAAAFAIAVAAAEIDAVVESVVEAA